MKYPLSLRLRKAAFYNTVNRIVLSFRSLNSSSQLFKRCSDCNTEIGLDLICPINDCGFIQPPPYSVNFFEAFKMEPTFRIDDKKLQLKFFDIQRKTHPDNFYFKKNAENSQNLSSWINKAYETLKNPLSRAIYLLELSKITVEESMELKDQNFLFEIMEINESIEVAHDVNILQTIARKLKDQLLEIENLFATAYDSKNYDEAQRLVVAYKYFQKALSSAQKKAQLYETYF